MWQALLTRGRRTLDEASAGDKEGPLLRSRCQCRHLARTNRAPYVRAVGSAIRAARAYGPPTLHSPRSQHKAFVVTAHPDACGPGSLVSDDLICTRYVKGLPICDLINAQSARVNCAAGSNNYSRRHQPDRPTQHLRNGRPQEPVGGRLASAAVPAGY